MTTLTIRPTGSPYQADGQVQCSNADYATAASGGGSFTGSGNTQSDRISVGQQFASGTHTIYTGRLRMPLTSVPEGAFVSNPMIELTKWFGLSTGTLYAYLYDSGSVVGSEDWVEPYQIPIYLTLLASKSLAGVSGTFQMDSTPALKAAIEDQAGGNLGILLVTSQTLAGTPSSGDERFIIRPAEFATEAQRPALILDYVLTQPVEAVGSVGAAKGLGQSGGIDLGIAAVGIHTAAQSQNVAGAARLGLKLLGVTAPGAGAGAAGAISAGVFVTGSPSAARGLGFAGTLRAGIRPQPGHASGKAIGASGVLKLGARTAGATSTADGIGAAGTPRAGVAVSGAVRAAWGVGLIGVVKIGLRPLPATSPAEGDAFTPIGKLGLKLLGASGAAAGAGVAGDVKGPPTILLGGTSTGAGLVGSAEVGVRLAAATSAAKGNSLTPSLRTGISLTGATCAATGAGAPPAPRVGIAAIVALGHSFNIGTPGQIRNGLRFAGTAAEGAGRGQAPFVRQPVELVGMAAYGIGEGFMGAVIARKFLATRFPETRRNRRFDT